MSDQYFLTVGIVLAVLGILSFVSGILSVIHCKTPVTGIITKLKDRPHHYKGKTVHHITPVIRYEADGKTYEAAADISTAKADKYRVGDKIGILFNLKKPDEFRVGKPVFPYVFGLLFITSGAVLIVCYFL